MLYIFTCEWMLHTPFAGRNNLFQRYNIFYLHKQKNEKEKYTKNINRWGVYQLFSISLKRGLTPKRWWTAGEK